MAQRPFIRANPSRPMRVCLVRPPTLTSASAVGQDAVPPLGVAYVAAAIRAAGHEVSAVDAVGEAVHQYSRVRWSEHALMHGLRIDELVARIDPRTEVIGVSCMFSVEWPITEELVTALRAAFPSTLIVLGGEHVTACPEFSLTACAAVDVGVLGEEEETIIDLLDAHAAGRERAIVTGVNDVNTFPFSPYPGTELFGQLLAQRKVRLDDDYFRDLLAYNDPENSISHADFIGSRGLSRLNLAAMSFFYVLSFSVRPQRALQLVSSLLSDDTSTRFTMALANRRRRRLAMKLSQRQGHETVVIPTIDQPRPVRH